MRRPWVSDWRTAAALGVVLFTAGCLLIYDAYDRRGGRTPWLLRLLSPL
jgi:hypothetical protein